MLLLAVFMLAGGFSGCASVPQNQLKRYKWPRGVYRGVPTKEFQKLGRVRTRVDYASLDFERTEAELCRNYFAKAAQDLLRRAREAGADAVIDLKSAVFQLDGQVDFFDTPECSDDGIQGSVLAQGVAIKWKAPLAEGERVRLLPRAPAGEESPARRVFAPAQGRSAPAGEASGSRAR
jgi:hypothetical protein